MLLTFVAASLLSGKFLCPLWPCRADNVEGSGQQNFFNLSKHMWAQHKGLMEEIECHMALHPEPSSAQ